MECHNLLADGSCSLIALNPYDHAPCNPDDPENCEHWYPTCHSCKCGHDTVHATTQTGRPFTYRCIICGFGFNSDSLPLVEGYVEQIADLNSAKELLLESVKILRNLLDNRQEVRRAS